MLHNNWAVELGSVAERLEDWAQYQTTCLSVGSNLTAATFTKTKNPECTKVIAGPDSWN